LLNKIKDDQPKAAPMQSRMAYRFAKDDVKHCKQHDELDERLDHLFWFF